MNELLSDSVARPRALVVSEIAPRSVVRRPDGRWFVDFGKAYFGTVRITLRADRPGTVEVCLGEKLNEAGAIDRTPPGSIRCRVMSLAVRAGTQTCRVEIPPDERNTRPGAIRMPRDLFEVLPFRYAEIGAVGGDALALDDIVMLAVHYPFNESAAAFECSDRRLTLVWDLCKHSIKATSFCGVYVDGDRERIPYEADAYINQLCHYGVDREYEIGRQTLEYLLFHPTWPTEWALHFVPMAWADYQYTGRTDLLERYYDELRGKLLLSLAREDGLISTMTGLVTPELLGALHLGQPMADIVDWPPGSFTQGGTGERDNHEMLPINTVVNAFHYWNLVLFARIADRLGRREDAAFCEQRAGQVADAMHRTLFDRQRGIFMDGEGSQHASLHANCFPAAFDLVPADVQPGVLRFIRSRGMACSVYGAQYLLEGAYQLGDAAYALDLMTAEHDRGWLNMLRAGSTVTLEAWDWRYKNNLDWNHAWGAAPANIIPRFLAGVCPAEPGFRSVRIAPQPAGLEWVRATVPTCRGPVELTIEQPRGKGKRLVIESPAPVQLDISGLAAPGACLRVEGAVVASPPAGRPYALGAGRHECAIA